MSRELSRKLDRTAKKLPVKIQDSAAQKRMAYREHAIRQAAVRYLFALTDDLLCDVVALGGDRLWNPSPSPSARVGCVVIDAARASATAHVDHGAPLLPIAGECIAPGIVVALRDPDEAERLYVACIAEAERRARERWAGEAS